jgi:hypothetical protein
MRAARTTAICVSGSRLTAAGVSGDEVIISVPVSATAQKQPVMPTRSASRAPRVSSFRPAPAQSSPASEAQATAEVGSFIAARYFAIAAGTSASVATISTVLDACSDLRRKRSSRARGSLATAGCGPACGWPSAAIITSRGSGGVAGIAMQGRAHAAEDVFAGTHAASFADFWRAA